MSTKVYLDLVRRPPWDGKGVPLPLQMSGPVKNNFFITNSKNTFIAETEASQTNNAIFTAGVVLHAFFFSNLIF